MGINSAGQGGPGEALFSRTQRRVLTLLFGQPERSRYVNEIVRFARVGIGSVQRELERLESAGLVTVSVSGNRKHYRANQQSPVFPELRGIVIKTFGLADVLRKALAAFGDSIEVAFVFGPLATGTDVDVSGVDVMIVARELSYADLATGLADCERLLGRPINPALYRPEDLRRKLAAGNVFLTRVVKQRKIFLVGGKHDLPRPNTGG